MNIKPGDMVEAQEAGGVWLPAIAESGVEGTHVVDYNRSPARSRKIHDFPVVWIRWPDDRQRRRFPWPAENVRTVDQHAARERAFTEESTQ